VVYSIERKDAEDEKAMVDLLQRLEATLRQENTLLEAGNSNDHTSFIIAKNQMLKELMLLQRNQMPTNHSDTMVAKLREVRGLVDRNFELLKIQVAAVKEVSALLTQGLMKEQCDGTYSRRAQ
jgi:hypothetical protein